MALTSWSSANYLTRAAAVGGTEPFLISVWANAPTGSAAFRYAYLLHTADTTFHRRGIRISNGDMPQAIATNASTNGVAASSGTHANNTWFHMAAAFVSSTSRRVWLNAANAVNDTTSIATITAPDRLSIGKDGGTASTFANTGGLAEISVWNATGMSEANMDSLVTKLFNGGAAGAGANPLNVKAESGQPWENDLLGYWNLPSTADLTDKSGNSHTLTMTGTLTNFGSHPTIDAVSTQSQAPRTIQQMMMRRQA